MTRLLPDLAPARPTDPDLFYSHCPGGSIWMGSGYVVIVEPAGEFAPAGWTRLSIRRDDREAIHDWRHFQEIKNVVCGVDRDALELYPSEDRLWDAANSYHLWVAPAGVRIGVGYPDRQVQYAEAPGEGVLANARQRPYGEPLPQEVT